MDKTAFEIARGEEAARLLGSELWRSAFAEVRGRLLDELAAMPSMLEEAAGQVHAKVRALDDVRKLLEGHITDGRIAAKKVDETKRGFLRRA